MNRIAVAVVFSVGLAAGVLVNQDVHAEEPAATPTCVELIHVNSNYIRLFDGESKVDSKQRSSSVADWMAAQMAEGHRHFTPTLVTPAYTVFCAY